MNNELEKRILGYFVWDYKTFFEWYDIKREDFEIELSKQLFDLIVRYKGNENLIRWEQYLHWVELADYMWECLWIMPDKWMSTWEEFNQLYNELKHRTAHRDMKKTAEDILFWIRQWKSDAELMNLVWNFYVYTPDVKSLDEVNNEILSDMTWVNLSKKYLTGYKELDKYLNWFLPWQFNIIAGRPSVWKSLIAVNFAMNHVINWTNTALFSLEMSNKEVMQRAYSMLSWVPMNFIKDWWDKESYDLVKQAIESFKWIRDNLFLFDDKLTLWQIVSEIRMLKKKHNIEVVYIDYLWIIGIKEWENRNLDISKITRTLKLLAKELKIVIVALAQLNRQAETWDKIPQLAHLRDSGSIEQDADDVIMPARLKDIYADDDNYTDDEKEKILRFYVRKNRNWPTWYTDFEVNYASMQLRDLPPKK